MLDQVWFQAVDMGSCNGWVGLGFERWAWGVTGVVGFCQDVCWSGPRSDLGIRDDSNSGHGELQGWWGFVKMRVVAVRNQTWVSVPSFSCDRLGLEFAFITLPTTLRELVTEADKVVGIPFLLQL